MTNQPQTEQPPKNPTPTNLGARRLSIFGLTAIIIALISASISLFIYTSSGDIYLDRSRPGFISDDEKNPSTEKPTNQTAAFPADGTITESAIDEYLKKLDSLNAEILSDPEAFSAEAISDETLNITIPDIINLNP